MRKNNNVFADFQLGDDKQRKFTRKDKRSEGWMEGMVSTDIPEKIEVKKIFSRFFIFYLAVVVSFGGLLFQLGRLQIAKGDYFKDLAEGNRIRKEVIRAPRGVIYDRNGNLLVKSVASFQVTIVPADLPDNEAERGAVLDLLSKTIDAPLEDLNKIYAEKGPNYLDPVIVKENVERDRALIVQTKYDELPGVRVEADPVREYEDPFNYAHLIGYIGRITEEEYKSKGEKNYDLNDYTGKTGLEYIYENYLKGKNGQKQIEVDAQGRPEVTLASIDPAGGNNLVLSIDDKLQKEMAKILEEGRGGKPAVAIAMNPGSGEILGMVSLPSFDGNLFAKGIDSAKYANLSNDPQKPLFNRSINGTYPTGSTIKPVTAAAGLAEGIINAGTTIVCNGILQVENQYNPDIVYNFPCWKTSGHGSENVVGALRDSCDIFFYTVGGGYKNRPGLGSEKLGDYFREFGLGTETGIDLPSEAAGLVPSREWKQSYKNETWGTGDTYHMAVGQGDILATPLQVLNFTAAMANGGKLIKPHLVKQVEDSSKNVIKRFDPEIIRENLVAEDNLNLIRRGMREVTKSGTARSLASLPFTTAGKTGTAQYGPNNSKEHAWFTVFAPFENPEIALVVLVEGGGEGSEVAVPIAKRILEYYFANK